ncbi:MAG: hypothetical protein FWE44_00635 [Defluviitaleaceae bacterium]|nr:hypothetical protein [Defluviitaleaceae bacterium]
MVTNHTNYFTPQQATKPFGKCLYIYKAADSGFKECEEPTLAEKLRAAVDAYKERLLRGMGALCDDEIEARIAEFIANYKPEDGSQEEMAQFYEKLLAFMKSLNEIKNREHVEKLLTTASADEQRFESKLSPFGSPLQGYTPNVAAMYSQMLATQ